MVLSIKDRETDEKVRKLAELTGETITDAVRIAVEERTEKVEREQRRNDPARLAAAMEVVEWGRRHRHLFSDIDADELLYDENGLPK